MADTRQTLFVDGILVALAIGHPQLSRIVAETGDDASPLSGGHISQTTYTERGYDQ